jgi:hypothetical protein
MDWALSAPAKYQATWIRGILWVILNCFAILDSRTDILCIDKPLKHALNGMNSVNDFHLTIVPESKKFIESSVNRAAISSRIFFEIIKRCVKIIGDVDQSFGTAKLRTWLDLTYRHQLNNRLVFLDQDRFTAHRSSDKIAQKAFRLKIIYGSDHSVTSKNQYDIL